MCPSCNSKGQVEGVSWSWRWSCVLVEGCVCVCVWCLGKLRAGHFTSGSLCFLLHKGDKNSPYLIGSADDSEG